MSKEKCLVLLSGGIDSSTILAKVVAEVGAENVMALCIRYGQKHEKELEAAVRIAGYYKVPLFIEDLTEVFKFDQTCPLLQGSTEEMPQQSYAEQLEAMGGYGTVKTYVPFRNGLFLSYATAVALQLKAKRLYYGAHNDDATGGAYPDCTEEFLESIESAIYRGTAGEVEVYAPFIAYNKAKIVAEGLALKVPYELTWSCYVGETEPCHKCGTCVDREGAFRTNIAEDPLLRKL